MASIATTGLWPMEPLSPGSAGLADRKTLNRDSAARAPRDPARAAIRRRQAQGLFVRCLAAGFLLFTLAPATSGVDGRQGLREALLAFPAPAVAALSLGLAAPAGAALFGRFALPEPRLGSGYCRP
jgi:hypothetical protein